MQGLCAGDPIQILSNISNYSFSDLSPPMGKILDDLSNNAKQFCADAMQSIKTYFEESTLSEIGGRAIGLGLIMSFAGALVALPLILVSLSNPNPVTPIIACVFLGLLLGGALSVLMGAGLKVVDGILLWMNEPTSQKPA